MARILIVDDEIPVLQILRMALEEEGYETSAAQSGEAAIDAYRHQHPDAVLMDIAMPGMDGIEALSEIRRIDPEARVAMVTAVGTHAAVRRALAAGARDFVLKPFDLDRIKGTILDLLAA